MIANITFPYVDDYMWHLDHTAPARCHRWGDWEFRYNSDEYRCDAWIIWQSCKHLESPITKSCPPNKTVLVTREPPDILELPPDYVRQFGMVLAPDARLRWHSGHRFSQFGQNWHVEKDYDELESMSAVPKSKLISAVISSKTSTRGHRQRLQLAQHLKAHFGDQFDHYGRGVNPIKDKWDAVAPYRYHLTMENGQWPHYWTEKLVDAYLAWCLPLYVGDPKIHEYFDPRSLIVLDPSDPETCVRQIQAAIETDAWTKVLPYIAEARQRILHDYHLYRVLHDLLEQEPPQPHAEVSVRPAADFDFPLSTKLRWKCRNAWNRIAQGEL